MSSKLIPDDFVVYRDGDSNIKTLGFDLNCLMPHENMPALKGGGNIPGRKSENNLVVPSGLALLNIAVRNKDYRERQNKIFNSYVQSEPQMLSEKLESELLKNSEEGESKSNKRTTRKNKFKGGKRRTRRKN